MSSNCPQPTDTPDDVDIEALREKYRQEREKRLRSEGSKQYVELEDDFAGYYETDPHSPPLVRDPIAEDIDVAVIGGGFAGLLCAAHLKKAGVDDVRIIELGGDFGGVWYWNRYPGIQCDNESYCYIPLLEELDFMPSKKFADGAEIYEHCRNIGKHFGLYDGAIFSTQVRDMRWDTRQAVADQHRPQRRHPRAIRGAGLRAIPPAQAARYPRHQGLPGTQLPHLAVGLLLHRRRQHRRAGQARRQDGRPGRHGRDRHPGDAVHRPACQAPLRVSAHTVHRRRPKQHQDRSGMGEVAAAGLATGAPTQLPLLDIRGDGARAAGPGLRLLDRTRAQHRSTGSRARGPRVVEPRAVHDDPRGRGLQSHGAAASPCRQHHRR